MMSKYNLWQKDELLGGSLSQSFNCSEKHLPLFRPGEGFCFGKKNSFACLGRVHCLALAKLPQNQEKIPCVKEDPMRA